MVVYGYARVSTEGQTLAAQESALHEAAAANFSTGKSGGGAAPRLSRPTVRLAGR